MSKLFKHNRDNQVGRAGGSLGRPLESGTDSDTEIFRKKWETHKEDRLHNAIKENN